MTSACTYTIAYVCTLGSLLVALPLFGAGYAPESYKEKNYVTGQCTVLSITAVRGQCTRSTCWAGTIRVSWFNPRSNLTLVVNETRTVTATSSSSAITILSRSYGVIGIKFNCFFDINKSQQSVVDELDLGDVISTQPAKPLNFLIPAIIFSFFFLLALVLTISLLYKEKTCRKAPAAAPAAVVAVVPPPPPAIAAPVAPVAVIQAPQPSVHASIDIRKLDLEASVSMNADNVCNICFSHHVNVTLKPCNHSFTCTTCGAYFVGKPCGLCRRMVTALELILDDNKEEDPNSAGSDSESTEMSNF